MRTLSLSYSTSTGKLSLVSDTSTVEGNVNDNNAITISVTGLPQSYLSAKIGYGVIIENNNTGTYYPFSELSGGSCTIPRRICRAATSGYLPIGLKITYSNEDVECSVNQLRIKLGTWRDAEDSMMDAFGDQIMTRGASWGWLSGWTYQEGAVVVHNDIFWRSLDDDNKGHEPAEGSSYWEYVSPIDVDSTVSTSSTNPVENQAITNYVNQLVATAAGTFMDNLTLTDLGLTYPATDSQIATALGTYEFSEEPTVNDFVIITVNNPSTTTVDKYEQFRYDGTVWQHEYDIDISAFTTTQWDAINSLIYNSGSTALDVVTVQSHIANTSNPHSVTKAQVGLGNCDNTSDEDKPVSTAQASAIGLVQGYLDAHEGNLNNPHQVTKSQVGLGNVDNTSDLNKPISTAVQNALTLETTARENADIALNGRADSLQTQVDQRVLIADGVTAWSATVTYTANAFCAVNGTLYRSLSGSNIGHNPLSSTGWWEEYASGSKESTGLIGPDNLFTDDIGDGVSTTIAVTHGLTSYDIVWALWSNADKKVTSVQAVKTSVDVLTLTFAIAPATDEYRILVYRPGDAARIYTSTFAPNSNDVVITHNLGRLPSGISLYAPDGTKVGVRMTVDTTTATLHFAGYDPGNYTIMVIA